MTGYGLDVDSPKYNRTQQTDAGPYMEKDGTIVKYDVDVASGTSGSAVEHEASGLVYAIHTHAFCDESPQSIQGTAIDHPGLQLAINCPLVLNVCADCNGNGILDQCDLNCNSTCDGCNVFGCGESSDCNSNGVPDECDQDCNQNAIPDDCEPPEPIRACCLDEGYVCELRTQACCELDGGTFYESETWCGQCALTRPQSVEPDP